MKMTVDQRGVTLAGDRFQLTTIGPADESGLLAPDDVVFGLADSAEMEEIVAELHALTRRSYGQFCGLARAMEMLGERWSLLIIRDLLVSPKTVTQLQTGLPRIPADILSARLREFEHAGILFRHATSGQSDSVKYELTEYGKELDDIILRAGRWGARQLGEPRPGEIITTDSMIMAMRATFQPQNAEGVRASYELRLGEIVLNMHIEDGSLTVAAGPLPSADLIFEPGVALKGLLSGDLGSADVVTDKNVRFTGDPALFDLFAQLFHIGPSM